MKGAIAFVVAAAVCSGASVVLDAQSLPKVKMPIGDRYAALPEWKPRTPRLKGYPY